MSDLPAKPCLLVVEDEFLIRLTLTEALADEGFEVLEASDGDEALALVEAHPEIAVLMTDIQLPGRLNGLLLVEQARRRRPDLPVIYMTGRPDNMTGSVPSTRDAFIAKPYLPSEIVRTVHAMTAAR